MDLQSLGWDDSFAEAFLPYEQDGLEPARAAVEHRSEYVVYTQHGERRAQIAGRLRHADEHPAVGDWVAVAAHTDDDRATIVAVLPRRSAFVHRAILARGRTTLMRTISKAMAESTTTRTRKRMPLSRHTLHSASASGSASSATRTAPTTRSSRNTGHA